MGNMYVLVTVDSFFKCLTSNIESKTIAQKFVMEFISCFGVLVQIKESNLNVRFPNTCVTFWR